MVILFTMIIFALSSFFLCYTSYVVYIFKSGLFDMALKNLGFLGFLKKPKKPKKSEFRFFLGF